MGTDPCQAPGHSQAALSQVSIFCPWLRKPEPLARGAGRILRARLQTRAKERCLNSTPRGLNISMSSNSPTLKIVISFKGKKITSSLRASLGTVRGLKAFRTSHMFILEPSQGLWGSTHKYSFPVPPLLPEQKAAPKPLRGASLLLGTSAWASPPFIPRVHGWLSNSCQPFHTKRISGVKKKKEFQGWHLQDQECPSRHFPGLWEQLLRSHRQSPLQVSTWCTQPCPFREGEMPGGAWEKGQPEWDLDCPCKELISEPLPSLLKG